MAVAQTLYTLEEAKRVLATRECLRTGHDYEIRSTLDGPTAILCPQCGQSWKVQVPQPARGRH